MLSLLAAAYLGVSGSLALPQGGSEMSRAGGALVRAGSYLSDNWAIEGEVGAEENLAVLAAQGLVHFSAWGVYDRYFGFSAFDPFLTFGAKGWVGSRPGQVGPKAGLGAFYHLDDHWSIRADADMTLGLDRGVEGVYSLAVGLQYGF